MSDKALIITYYWPPGAGAGVQRWLKFTKYLPSFGIEPVVLTVDPEFAAYPAIDHSLIAEIPPDIKIFSTRATDYFRVYKKNKKEIPSAGFANADKNGIKDKILRFIRGNFFIPDPRKGWNKHAFKKACEIIDNEGIKHIITTSPPHSTQLIGLRLKKQFPSIKWIADLRDPWTDIYYYDQFYHSFLSKTIDKRLENQVLLSADKIITVGESLKDLFRKKIPSVNSTIEVITNGYDDADFKDKKSTNPDKFTISYIGTLSDAYPINTFLNALRVFEEKGIDLNLRFVGSVSPNQKELILSKAEKSSVDFIPFVDHSMAIDYMNDTTVLLLIIPDHQSNKSIITGKLFEYIATGKPVLCIGPADGDAAKIIKYTASGSTFSYDDLKGIESLFRDLIINPGLFIHHSATDFSRRNLTARLVEILNQM